MSRPFIGSGQSLDYHRLSLPPADAHALDADRPLERLQAELLILLKGYDDTFTQTVIARYSYRHDEFRWDRRFAPAFFVSPEGDMVLELRKVGALEAAS